MSIQQTKLTFETIYLMNESVYAFHIHSYHYVTLIMYNLQSLMMDDNKKK